MSDESRIEGVQDLFDKLGKLESLVTQKQILVRALRAGGPDRIAEEASRRAPVESGELSENIGVSIQEQTATEAIARIGPTRSVFYGRFPEFGTKHIPEEPFLEPAFEATKEEAVQITARALAELIEREISK